MRNAIGFVIVLWGLTHFLGTAFSAFGAAATQSFQTWQTAALKAEEYLLTK